MSVTRETLALLGMRCSGKTTVGQALARRLGRAFVDLDDEVLRVGRYAGLRAATVGELLVQAGPALFRELEATALRKELEPCPGIVLATGGGVVEREDNRVWLERCATCVFLSVPVEVLRARLAADPTPRPPLLGTDAAAELEELRARRLRWYLELADLVIEAGEGAPEELAERIEAQLAAATGESRKARDRA